MHPSATACPNKSQPYIPTPSPEIRSSKRHPHCPKNPATSRGISVTAASKTLDARQAADAGAPLPGPDGGGRIKPFSSHFTRRLPSSSTATASTPASRRTQPAAPGPQPGNRPPPLHDWQPRAPRPDSIIFLPSALAQSPLARARVSDLSVLSPHYVALCVQLEGSGRRMDRYQRVEKPREEAPIKENEIRITTQGRMRNYITYATALLQVPPPARSFDCLLFSRGL